MKSKDAQFGNGALQDFDLDNMMASIAFSARPLSFLSFEWETAWQENRMKSDITDSKVDRLKHQLDIIFPVTSKWMFSLKNNIYQSLNTDDNSWFTDFAASYTYKRMEFQLNVNNMLGKSTYEREFVSSIETNYYRYMLRPREVLAKVSFTF